MHERFKLKLGVSTHAVVLFTVGFSSSCSLLMRVAAYAITEFELKSEGTDLILSPLFYNEDRVSNYVHDQQRTVRGLVGLLPKRPDGLDAETVTFLCECRLDDITNKILHNNGMRMLSHVNYNGSCMNG